MRKIGGLVTKSERMIPKIPFHFEGEIWQHQGPGGWFFVSLPPELSQEIRSLFKSNEEGWGRLPVLAKTGDYEWKTAIWFDSKKNTYLLPIKAEIRIKNKIAKGVIKSYVILL